MFQTETWRVISAQSVGTTFSASLSFSINTAYVFDLKLDFLVRSFFLTLDRSLFGFVRRN